MEGGSSGGGESKNFSEAEAKGDGYSSKPETKYQQRVQDRSEREATDKGDTTEGIEWARR